MGYLKAWKSNLRVLAFPVVIAAGMALVFVIVRANQAAEGHGPGDRAKVVVFSVSGRAPGGVAVSESEDGSSSTLITSQSRVPFQTDVGVDGSDSYSFQAQLLGSGRIKCTVRIGSVVDVKEATGRQGTCTPSVEESLRGEVWSGA